MKNKIHKISIVLGIIGIFIVIASTIRWFFLFPDTSQLIIANLIGIVILGFAYLYETIKRIDEQIIDFDRALDAMNIYFRDEIAKIHTQELSSLEQSRDVLVEKNLSEKPSPYEVGDV